MVPRSQPIRRPVVWFVLAVAGAAGACVPAALGIGAMSGGPALTFVGCLVALVGVALGIASGLRLRIFERLLAGKGALAQWTLPRAAATEHLARTFADERKQGWRLFFLLAALSVAVGVFFVLIGFDGGPPILLASAGVVTLLAVLAALVPRVRHEQRSRAAQEAIVSLDAAYVAGTLYVWGGFGARIEDVGIVLGGTPTLQITYSTPLFYERRVISVSIPRGEEGHASEAARALEQRRGSLAGPS